MTPAIPKLSPILDQQTLQALAAALAESGHVRRPSSFSVDVAKVLGQLLVAALLAYGIVNSRVAVLESRVDTLRSDITEIRQDVKLLLQRVR